MAKYTFGFKCTFKNRLRGSTSTVLTAMALLMGDSNFRPPPTEYTHPLTDHQRICYRWLRRQPLWLCQIWCKSAHGGFWVNGLNITKIYLLILFEELTYRSDSSTDFHAWWLKRRGLAERCAFWGFCWYCSPFWGWNPPKKPNFGAWIRVFKPNGQILKVSYYWNYCIDFNQIVQNDRDHQVVIVGGPNTWRDPFENPRRPAPQSWKSQRSWYRRNGLTDLYEIWYGDEKMGLLTAPTIKRFDLQKIQHGGWPPFWKLLNHYISATVWPFLMKFGTVVHNSHQNLT